MDCPHAETATAARLRAAGCVFAEAEAALLHAEATDDPALEALVARRIAGEPLEVVVGWAEFCGLRVPVEPGVFVPRRRTGYLVDLAVEQVLSLAGRAERRPVVVDLCCGTGAVGLAVAARSPELDLHAADLDPAACACARRTLSGVRAWVHEGDLCDALPPALCGTLDLLLVNAPYVPSAEVALLPPEAREHEPRWALDGGGDGVELHRRVAAQAARWLRPGGVLLVETSRPQAALTARAVAAAGLRERVRHSSSHDATVVGGARVAGL